ncbi:MAG: chloramphenicol phosphotransferase CPT family protein [Alphaproteobacteria bacterium]|nr:chloramphenicol phosphotransferase CPT family protein [Alphaproteobacteria bacterium]
MIIFLNGTSSTGKSSVARELMRQSQIPFLHYASDHLLNFWIDSKFVNSFKGEQKPQKWQAEWFCRQQAIDKNGHAVFHIKNGKKGWTLYCDLVKAACDLMDKGYDMIVDEVIISESQIPLYYSSLINKYVYMVYIYCENIEMERREKKRGDRNIGLSRGLLEDVDKIINTYDLKIDTTHLSAAECARSILNFIESNPKPTAVKKLMERYSQDCIVE